MDFRRTPIATLTALLRRSRSTARSLEACAPLRMRPFLIGFAAVALLQACAAVSVVGTAASLATSAATTTVEAGVAVAGAGASATGAAIKAATP
jgi:hypothetical protein